MADLIKFIKPSGMEIEVAATDANIRAAARAGWELPKKKAPAKKKAKKEE